MKIYLVGAKFFHVEGQTDRQDKTKLITTFHNSVNTLK